MTHALGFEVFFSGPEFTRLLSRLALDLVFAVLLIQQVYVRRYRTRELVFTYFLLNVITFFLCLLLARASASLAFGLALFGIFGILRFRTEQIRTRDLTYLFILIGIGIINAIAGDEVGLAGLLTINGAIVGLAALLELTPKAAAERITPMVYDQLELLRPGNEVRLAADIGTRTGLAVLRVEIQRIDFLRDAADIIVIHARPAGDFPQPMPNP